MPNKFKSSANTTPVDQAVGKVLAHDITEIRPGQLKGVAFGKGHIVREEDISRLRRLGKEHLFVLHIRHGEIHEDEAALRLAKALTGQGVAFDGQPSEGKINLKEAHKGLLKVNVQALTELCLIPAICCASRHINIVVEKGEIVCVTRAIPLIIDEMTLSAAVHIAEAAGGRRGVWDFCATGSHVSLWTHWDVPVLGVPTCVLFYKATVLDILLPRVLAGEIITRKDLTALAHGGLCLNCEKCHYPVCPFGK